MSFFIGLNVIKRHNITIKNNRKERYLMQKSNRYIKPDERLGKEGTFYEINQRCLIIRLNEELDHHNAIQIRKKADRMIERNYIKNIIFDFSGAEFMDSAGIGVIMGRYKKVIFIGGSIAVANVSSPIDRIFRLSGLYKIIAKYDSVEAALNHFG
jgi:stage II sporulation protein AA (anti-sigma F factor antagonist)